MASQEELADLSAAKQADNLINSIPKVVVLDHECFVQATRLAYDKLTENQKSLVVGKDALEILKKSVGKPACF